MTLTTILPFKHDQAPGRAFDDSFLRPSNFKGRRLPVVLMADPQMPNQPVRPVRPAAFAHTASTAGTACSTGSASTASTTGTTSTASTTGTTAREELEITTFLCFSLLCDQIYPLLFKMSFHSFSDLGE